MGVPIRNVCDGLSSPPHTNMRRNSVEKILVTSNPSIMDSQLFSLTKMAGREDEGRTMTDDRQDQDGQ